ncbi:hypothetical protein GCM10010411_72590 [Actinomadura fulvescens]|uniref:Lasso RiPP family leader peptide-containing protein n=1 Tax=Actinomadura fulvescens TaxID=46160 RepID=A0ABP6CTF5_9ACTN
MTSAVDARLPRQKTVTSAGIGSTKSPVRRLVSVQKGEVMHTYERPTLTPAGSFFRKTGLVGRPPRDSLGGRQAL